MVKKQPLSPKESKAVPAGTHSVLTHLRTPSLWVRSWSPGDVTEVLRHPPLVLGPPKTCKIAGF